MRSEQSEECERGVCATKECEYVRSVQGVSKVSEEYVSKECQNSEV